MFEKAIRNKIRFSYKGQLSVEDLWDLSQSELNEIYLPLKSQLDQAEKGSLLGDKPKSMDVINYKIEILKYIATVKKDEANKKEEAVSRKQKKAKLLDLLERKENSELEAKSSDEIKALINDLGTEEVA